MHVCIYSLEICPPLLDVPPLRALYKSSVRSEQDKICVYKLGQRYSTCFKPYSRRNICIPSPDMSTGSLSDADEFHDAELLDGLLPFGSDRDTAESSNSEGAHTGHSARTPGKRRRAAASRRAGAGAGTGTDSGAALPEGKQVQRNAANARERARMRVLSKAFSRLKTTLPWVPPDTKLSKLDTLRLASSYIAHLRQILANDKHEHGYIHPVNLTWPFMVAGKPENELKEMMNSTRLCGTTAS